ncbi:MAG: hypothetical protein JWN02_1573 [Acidobacteria bacterium]|nr:hypothetical protein [Acidobacteriota bacterium]
MYLDSLTPLHFSVGHGTFGIGADLGYGGRRVQVGKRDYVYALSTHALARIADLLAGRYSSFRCSVVIDEDVSPEWGEADFGAGEGSFPLVVNEGIFAGGREAMLALDETIRNMPAAPRWMESTSRVWWRSQFEFHLSLACLEAGVELDRMENGR